MSFFTFSLSYVGLCSRVKYQKLLPVQMDLRSASYIAPGQRAETWLIEEIRSPSLGMVGGNVRSLSCCVQLGEAYEV